MGVHSLSAPGWENGQDDLPGPLCLESSILNPSSQVFLLRPRGSPWWVGLLQACVVMFWAEGGVQHKP